MLKRIVSGIIASAILAAILLLPSWVLGCTVLAASLLGIYEYARAVRMKGIKVDLPVSYAAAFVLVVYSFFTTLPAREGSPFTEFVESIFTDTAIGAGLFLIVVFLFSRILFENGKYKMDDVAYTLFGIVYIPYLLSFAAMIRNMDRGSEYIWMVIIGASVTDIFAYFSGTLFGRNKIIPDISPKKTVEGSIGGALGSMLTMLAYGGIFINRAGAPRVEVYHFLIMGLLCGVISQIGDWAASAIKRTTGVKDFGNLIPGHGGIMDRCDSILFVAPVVYFYISIFF
jgi:phosphatidate cytidylyltransferase